MTAAPVRARRARLTAIGLAWLIWIVTVLLALWTTIGQGWLLAFVVLGFVPYFLSILVIEPRLERN